MVAIIKAVVRTAEAENSCIAAIVVEASGGAKSPKLLGFTL